MFLTASNITDFTVPLSSIPANVRNTVIKSDQGHFALSYGGFGQWYRFCIKKSISFRCYERYDAGGGCGYVFHILSERDKQAIQNQFNLRDTDFGDFHSVRSGYAFSLLNTNCDSSFRIPSSQTFIPFLVFINKQESQLFNEVPYIVRQLQTNVYQVLPISVEQQLDDHVKCNEDSDYVYYYCNDPFVRNRVLSKNSVTFILQWLQGQANNDGYSYCLVFDENYCFYLSPNEVSEFSDSAPTGGIVLLPGNELLPEGTKQIPDFELYTVLE